jgi:hypothetical protein
MPTVIGVGQLGKWMAETAKAFFVVTQCKLTAWAIRRVRNLLKALSDAEALKVLRDG